MSEALNTAAAEPALQASGPVAGALVVGGEGRVSESLSALTPALFSKLSATSIWKNQATRATG